MTKARTVKIRVRAEHAAAVGLLIKSRVALYQARLAATPLAALPAFGMKLLASARRKRNPTPFLIVWSLDRIEAVAGFHYLALFSHPAIPPAFLDETQASAVQAIALHLAQAIVSHRGPERLSRAAAEERVRPWQAATSTECDVVEERWAQRLIRRLEREDALRASLLHEIPPFVFRLLAPPEIYP